MVAVLAECQNTCIAAIAISSILNEAVAGHHSPAEYIQRSPGTRRGGWRSTSPSCQSYCAEQQGKNAESIVRLADTYRSNFRDFGRGRLRCGCLESGDEKGCGNAIRTRPS